MTAAERPAARTAWAIIGSCLCLQSLCGCARQERDGFSVTTDVVAPAILRSEADQVGIAVRIEAPLKFTNGSDREKQIAVSKTGCSCYGVATGEKLVEPGEWIAIPSGTSRDLFFVAKRIEGETEQAFRAAFSVRDSEGGRVSDVTANCTMKIFRDLSLEPSTFVDDLPPTAVSMQARTEYKLVLRQVTRGRRTNPVPKFAMSPALLTATNFEVTGQPTEVAPGLWQTEWTNSLSLTALPETVRENGGRYAFSIEVPEIPVGEGTRSRNDSSLPTLLDVVRDLPQRRIAGQLVLRRSRGVIAPGQIHFGSIASGEHRERRIVLNAADHVPFKVQVEQTPPLFHVVVDSTDAATQQWITVTLSAEGARDLDETLILRTTHPDQPEVRVGLKARIAQPSDAK